MGGTVAGTVGGTGRELLGELWKRSANKRLRTLTHARALARVHAYTRERKYTCKHSRTHQRRTTDAWESPTFTHMHSRALVRIKNSRSELETAWPGSFSLLLEFCETPRAMGLPDEDMATGRCRSPTRRRSARLADVDHQHEDVEHKLHDVQHGPADVDHQREDVAQPREMWTTNTKT